ncbi:MAG: hypothetical protein ACTSQI_04025 [Candidatus Helarchaeota archaeon]
MALSKKDIKKLREEREELLAQIEVFIQEDDYTILPDLFTQIAELSDQLNEPELAQEFRNRSIQIQALIIPDDAELEPELLLEPSSSPSYSPPSDALPSAPVSYTPPSPSSTPSTPISHSPPPPPSPQPPPSPESSPNPSVSIPATTSLAEKLRQLKEFAANLVKSGTSFEAAEPPPDEPSPPSTSEKYSVPPTPPELLSSQPLSPTPFPPPATPPTYQPTTSPAPPAPQSSQLSQTVSPPTAPLPQDPSPPALSETPHIESLLRQRSIETGAPLESGIVPTVVKSEGDVLNEILTEKLPYLPDDEKQAAIEKLLTYENGPKREAMLKVFLIKNKKYAG